MPCWAHTLCIHNSGVRSPRTIFFLTSLHHLSTFAAGRDLASAKADLPGPPTPATAYALALADMRLTTKSWIISACALLASCDAFYHIPINGSTHGATFTTSCGSLKVKMINWQGHSFDLYQNYDLTEPVMLYSDSIKAIWRNQTYDLVFTLPANERGSRSIKVAGLAEIRTTFHIAENVKKGDTIIIIPAGYLHCNGKRITLDTMTLAIQEDLKSPFSLHKN